jgi:hypothetical protein
MPPWQDNLSLSSGEKDSRQHGAVQMSTRRSFGFNRPERRLDSTSVPQHTGTAPSPHAAGCRRAPAILASGPPLPCNAGRLGGTSAFAGMMVQVPGRPVSVHGRGPCHSRTLTRTQATWGLREAGMQRAGLWFHNGSSVKVDPYEIEDISGLDGGICPSLKSTNNNNTLLIYAFM